jgi:hypothetical protein
MSAARPSEGAKPADRAAGVRPVQACAGTLEAAGLTPPVGGERGNSAVVPAHDRRHASGCGLQAAPWSGPQGQGGQS